MKLTYVGGPTLLLEYGGQRFLTDPTFDPEGGKYKAGPVTLTKTEGPAVSSEQLGHVDAVLLSHDHHSDNLDHAGRLILEQAGKVLATVAGAERLGGNSIGLSPWQTLTIGRVEVIGTPARHGPSWGDRGPVTGFVLRSEGEKTVYVSGDTVWYEGIEEVIRRFPDIGVAVLFLGAAHVPVLPAHLTFTAAEAVLFSQALPEATIVPVHFEGWKHFREGRSAISAAFEGAGIGDRLRWLVAGEGTEVS